MLLNLALFAITFAAGLLPLALQQAFNERRLQLLLAFSGSFLLGITFLHLLPEVFSEEVISLQAKGRSPVPLITGACIIGGFFLQLLIQRATHGVEHGHTHVHPHGSIPLAGIITGLSLHAFMEGIPLGFNYREAATTLPLYLAVTVHKLPETMLLAILISGVRSKRSAIITLLFFACLTPVAATISRNIGQHYHAMEKAVSAVIAVVAGAFIHIATTIFYESGTKQHQLSRTKVVAMIVGVGCALATLFFE